MALQPAPLAGSPGGQFTPPVLELTPVVATDETTLVSPVLLVNPVRDGLNLVAMEGPILNERDAVLCLSREAGAFDVLREHCVEVQPFDVSQTADALHAALTMAPDERARRSAGLRTAAQARTADAWLEVLVTRAR